jgi:hypothetical protein
MDTYYRIHPAGEAPESILDESRWESRVWIGETYKRCEACNGEGYTLDDEMTECTCDTCGGEGQVEDVRRGVSCCRSLDDLRAYFRDRGASLCGDTLLVLEGELSDDEDHDAADGAVLVLPRRIVRTSPVHWS